MSKATRIRQQSAREKIAAQRAAARRAEIRNRVLIAGGSVVVVLAIVLTFVFIKLGSKPSSGASGATSVTGTALPASVTSNITGVPPGMLNTVGIGSLSGGLPISAISDKPLTSGGKPEMLYIGAEFCPYCAAMRWSMAVALSRFGTLSPLHGIYSSSAAGEPDPHTATPTFYKTTYASNYLAFTPVENETVTHAPLQATTAAQQALWAKYDTSSQGLGYPFIDIGNKYVIKGPLFDPAVLAGMSWAQIAAALHDPSSKVAQAADGTANLITAAICKVTNGQPGSVCTSAAVTKASGSL
jgi:Domain of unknown function (DUF929)